MADASAPLALLVRHAQWIVVGRVTAVVWDAAVALDGPFYPDQVVRVRVGTGLKDRRGWFGRLRERGPVLVHKPYSARRLGVGDRGIFFLTRNAVPPQGGPPFDRPARATGDLHVGLSQPYRVDGILARWVSNGLAAPWPEARLAEVRAALAGEGAGRP